MYRVSQLMSTPVANSSRTDRGHAGELSPTCIFPSFACDFLDGDSSFECCSVDPLTGSHHVCRRSPRLLTNGYYIWTEDSFLCDPDGHITLNPFHTSVIYKENLVRIFRKKKRTHRSLSSLLDIRASKSWLHGSIFGDSELLPSEDIWLEGIRSLESSDYNENGGDLNCSLSDGLESQIPITDTAEAASSIHALYQPLRGSSQHSPQTQRKESKHFQENILGHSKTSVMNKVSFQAILLTACLIISACARWLMGGEFVNVFTWPLVITIVYVVKSLFLKLASYFKATTYAWFDSP